MASNPLKQPALHAFDDNDSNIDHPVGKREDHRNKAILDGQATLLPVLASYGSTDDATYVIENSLMALKVMRVEEYRQPVYIPPMAKANLQAKDVDLFPLMAKVQEFLDSDRQVMLILGDSGAGKSTFNRHLEHHLWTHYTNGDPIPLIINLPAIERPDQDMITKQLQMHDISNDQIQEMKHHCQFILICDGYDESQLTANLHQTNRLNQRGQWRTKMIISCRTQFLGPAYVDRFAPQLKDRYTKARSDLFQEAVIIPFSKEQVEDYVARYVPLEPRPWVTKDYMLMLTTIPNLMDLVRNPFLLTLTLEALPSVTRSRRELSSISISRVQLYDHFVNEWLGVNMRRLRDSTLANGEREMLEILIEKGFIFLGVEYSKRLALAIFKKHDGNPVVHYLHYDHKNTWRAEFFGSELEVRFLRESSPLTRTGSLYRFIHRSMLEYFFSRTVFDPKTHDGDDEFAPQPEFVPSDVQPLDPNGPLFTLSLLTEPSIIQFLCERAKQSPSFEKQLRNVVELSKTDSSAVTAAANAMTILVRAGTCFHGADLQGIRIPGADLSGGQFDSAQLQGADLRGVNLTRSWFRQADISHAQMEGVRFGELPYLKEEGEVTACAYSPDGTRFVTATGKGVRGIINVYNTSTWTRINTFYLERQTLDCLRDWISTKSIAFSPDSRHFVTGSDDGTVRLWNCAEGRKVFELKVGPGENDVTVEFSPCGKRVASAWEHGNAQVWNIETGETVFAMEGDTGKVQNIKYSPDGSRLVLICDNGLISFWDAVTGDPEAVWNAPDGRQLASGYYCGFVRLWDTETVHAGFRMSIKHWPSGLVSSPDGRVAATSRFDNTVTLCDVGDDTRVSIFPGHTEEVLNTVFSPDSRQLATAGRDTFVRLWDVDSSEAGVRWPDPTDVGLCVIFTVHGCLIFSQGESYGSLRLWNPLTGAVQAIIQNSFAFLREFTISPDGSNFVTEEHSTFQLWDCQTGKAGLTVEAPPRGRVQSFVYSPCGRWILSTSIYGVELWDLQYPEKTKTIASFEPVTEENHVCAEFSPTTTTTELRIAVSVSVWPCRLDLYDLTTGDLLKRVWLAHHVKPHSLAFSPDGQQLAVGTENDSIVLWSHPMEEEPSVRLEGHIGSVYCVAYSSCGNWLASGSKDRTVRIWCRRQQLAEDGDVEAESWSCATVVRGFFEGVLIVSWNPHAPLEFVTGSQDGAIRIWRISVGNGNGGGGGDVGEGCITVHLVWGSNLRQLCVEGLRFEDAKGLSPVYEKLLLQRGAVRAITPAAAAAAAEDDAVGNVTE